MYTTGIIIAVDTNTHNWDHNRSLHTQLRSMSQLSHTIGTTIAVDIHTNTTLITIAIDTFTNTTWFIIEVDTRN